LRHIAIVPVEQRLLSAQQDIEKAFTVVLVYPLDSIRLTRGPHHDNTR